MSRYFKITKRHYDIIIQQAKANYPQECGGFLGGKELTISAILPTFNQHLYNKTDTFGITSEDIGRAHEFFAKHGLEYFGVYHTHPKAPAEPSHQDLRNIQRYMFIISLLNFEDPDFAAYEVSGSNYERIPLQLIKELEVVDLHSSTSKNSSVLPAQSVKSAKPAPDALPGDIKLEAKALDSMVNDIAHGRVQYPKLRPRKKGSSDFSTLA